MKTFIKSIVAQAIFLCHLFRDNLAPKPMYKQVLVTLVCLVLLPLQLIWMIALATIALFSSKMRECMNALEMANANYQRGACAA